MKVFNLGPVQIVLKDSSQNGVFKATYTSPSKPDRDVTIPVIVGAAVLLVLLCCCGRVVL